VERIEAPLRSVSPVGEGFTIPSRGKSQELLAELRGRAEEERRKGREFVIVIGLGFVGTVMAGAIADATSPEGDQSKLVIDYQRPSPKSFWKIPTLNRGESPVASEDLEVPEIIRRCVIQKKGLAATHTSEVLGLSDVVVVDVQCDCVRTPWETSEQARATRQPWRKPLLKSASRPILVRWFSSERLSHRGHRADRLSHHQAGL
jgi:hypothetical protein